MKVSDVMTRLTHVTTPDETLRGAVLTTSEQDADARPVGENDRLVGMITDRDIAIRGVAGTRHPDTRVREIMTAQVRTCFEDDDLDQAAGRMAELQMRRLPVLERNSHLVGIVALADLATSTQPGQAQEALRGVSRSDRAAKADEPSSLSRKSGLHPERVWRAAGSL